MKNYPNDLCFVVDPSEVVDTSNPVFCIKPVQSNQNNPAPQNPPLDLTTLEGCRKLESELLKITSPNELRQISEQIMAIYQLYKKFEDYRLVILIKCLHKHTVLHFRKTCDGQLGYKDRFYNNRIISIPENIKKYLNNVSLAGFNLERSIENKLTEEMLSELDEALASLRTYVIETENQSFLQDILTLKVKTVNNGLQSLVLLKFMSIIRLEEKLIAELSPLFKKASDLKELYRRNQEKIPTDAITSAKQPPSSMTVTSGTTESCLALFNEMEKALTSSKKITEGDYANFLRKALSEYAKYYRTNHQRLGNIIRFLLRHSRFDTPHLEDFYSKLKNCFGSEPQHKFPYLDITIKEQNTVGELCTAYRKRLNIVERTMGNHGGKFYGIYEIPNFIEMYNNNTFEPCYKITDDLVQEMRTLQELSDEVREAYCNRDDAAVKVIYDATCNFEDVSITTRGELLALVRFCKILLLQEAYMSFYSDILQEGEKRENAYLLLINPLDSAQEKETPTNTEAPPTEVHEDNPAENSDET